MLVNAIMRFHLKLEPLAVAYHDLVFFFKYTNTKTTGGIMNISCLINIIKILDKLITSLVLTHGVFTIF